MTGKRLATLLLAGLCALAAAEPAAATFPGRKGLIAYPAQDGLRATAPNGSTDQLLAPIDSVRDPAWSADGRRAAFTANPEGFEDSREIFINDVWTGRTRPVTHNVWHEHSPSFSPKGDRIAFVREQGDRSAIYVIGAYGGRAKLLLTGGFVTDAEWSPDGSAIAYVSDGDVFVADAKGRKRTRIVDFPAGGGDVVARELSWSPDSRHLALGTAVNAPCENCDQLWRVRRNGTGLTALTPGPGEHPNESFSAPLWSPGGTAIAFCRTDLSPEGFGTRALWALAPSGGERRKLADGGCGGDWQPLAKRARPRR